MLTLLFLALESSVDCFSLMQFLYFSYGCHIPMLNVVAV